MDSDRENSELASSDLAAFGRLGIGAELLAKARVRRVTDQEARDIYGITGSVTKDMSGVVFPYFSRVTGRRVTARVRRDNPEIEAGKEENKYLSAYGDQKHLFFPPGAAEKLQDAGTFIVLVEAEKSALALTAYAQRTGANLLAVGMGGCWGWRGRNGKVENARGVRVDQKGPISDLDCVDGRKVFVLLDSNAANNSNVLQARTALVRELCKRKCEVLVCNLPVAVNGPDDMLAKGGDSAIDTVLELAKPAQDVAIADAEAAIEKLSSAASDGKPGEIVRGMEAVADVSDELRREVLVGRLAKAAHGIIAKKTIRDGIAERLRTREQERTERAQQLQYAAVGPIDAAEVAEQITEFFRRYFVLPEHFFVILTIWVLHTHVVEAFDYTPYLTITSPTKRCAKSNLLTALGLLVAKPWRTSSTSVASMARKIEQDRCTMLLDESDQAFKGPTEYTSALQGVLNSGFEKSGIYSRCVGEGTALESKDFSTYCAKAIAGIKRLPDTVTDRSIPLHLQRKRKGQQVERFRSKRVKPEGAALKKLAEVWAARVQADIAHHEPQVLEQLNDRAWDVCEPLMACAEHIGQGWDIRLRDALLATFGAEAEDEDTGVQLLRDLKKIIGEGKDDEKIASADIVAQLKAIETSPWSDWNKGKGLSANGLARMLKDFGIFPTTVRIGDRTPKGYLRSQFKTAWDTYTPSPTSSEDYSCATTQQANNDAGLGPFSDRNKKNPVADEKSASDPHKQRDCCGVADQDRQKGLWTGSADEPAGDGFVEGVL